MSNAIQSMSPEQLAAHQEQFMRSAEATAEASLKLGDVLHKSGFQPLAIASGMALAIADVVAAIAVEGDTGMAGVNEVMAELHRAMSMRSLDTFKNLKQLTKEEQVAA